jgi:hypothetical protein
MCNVEEKQQCYEVDSKERGRKLIMEKGELIIKEKLHFNIYILTHGWGC